MLFLIKWIYAWLLPIGCIAAALVFLTIYLYWRRSPGRKPLLVITVLLYALSVQPVSNMLMKPLENSYAPPHTVQGDVIILLGGGTRAGVPDFDGTGQVGSAAANRFLTAVRMQRKLDLPILLSGGAVFSYDADEAEIDKRMLLSLGVVEDRIFLDNQSRNTAENARFSKDICTEQGWKHPIVITSAFHMPRSVVFFKRAGMDITPYPCDYYTDEPYHWSAFSVIPNSFTLYTSCLAIKEYVGIAAAKTGLQ